MLDRPLRTLLMLSAGHCNILPILLMYITLSTFWYNNVIVSYYFTCKGEASTLVLAVYYSSNTRSWL